MKLLFENWRKYLNEEQYDLNRNEPPPIKDVISNWASGNNAFQVSDYHGKYSVDDLMEYRDLREESQLTAEEMNVLMRDMKEAGVTEPLIIQIGRNGQARIAKGNNVVEIARQLNIKELPVKFVFKERVMKANKITQEPIEMQKAIEDQGSVYYSDGTPKDHSGLPG